MARVVTHHFHIGNNQPLAFYNYLLWRGQHIFSIGTILLNKRYNIKSLESKRVGTYVDLITEKINHDCFIYINYSCD